MHLLAYVSRKVSGGGQGAGGAVTAASRHLIFSSSSFFRKTAAKKLSKRSGEKKDIFPTRLPFLGSFGGPATHSPGGVTRVGLSVVG